MFFSVPRSGAGRVQLPWTGGPVLVALAGLLVPAVAGCSAHREPTSSVESPSEPAPQAEDVEILRGSEAPPAEPEPVLDDLGIPICALEPPPGSLMVTMGGVREPELISRVEPVYPERARLEGIEGLVLLQVVVESDGSVSEVRVLRQPSPDPGFTQAAVAAVEQWRYKPATQGPCPVAVLMSVRVPFSLD